MRKINLLIISIVLLSVNLAFGQENTQGKLSNYTRFFLSSVENRDIDSLPIKKIGLKSIQGTGYVNCFIKLTNTENLDELRNLGVIINTVTPTIITAQVPVNQMEAVAALPQVTRLEVATPVKKKMNNARTKAFVDNVHQGVDLPRAFKGNGVVVGIIDGGFEYKHINFFNSTGTKFRVKRAWNQNTDNSTPPAGYNYGGELADSAAIINAKYDYVSYYDYDLNRYVYETHGTHVAGIAAGGYSGLNYIGVAPEADIVMVSYDEDDNSLENASLIDGINYVYNYATLVGKPAVANMSLGWHLGPHDGTSMFDQMCDQLQGAGKLLVGAAGNEGRDNLHISKTFNAVTDTLKTFINVQYGGEYADIWGTPNKDMKIKIVTYRKATNQILFQTNFIDANTYFQNEYNLTSNSSGATGRIYLETEKNPLNNKPNAFVQLSITLNSGVYAGIIVTSNDGATVNGWCADGYSTFMSNSVAGWTNGDKNSTVGEIGGTGNRIISVGSFNSGNNNISNFSSKGPTADGRLKPDIAAPGAVLISSFDSIAVAGNRNDPYTVQSTTNTVTENGKNYYFGEMQGTSMASPFVAGVLALWLEANPQLTPEAVRNVLRETSITDTYTGTIPAAGSNTWGYGKINAWNGIKYILNQTGIFENTVNQNFITIQNPVSGAAQITFKYNDNEVSAFVMDMNGRLLIEKKINQISENQQETITETATLPAGAYILYIKGNEKKFGQKIIVK